MINKIAFIGAGSMAEAIISGIIKNGFLQSNQVFVTNRNDEARLNYLHKTYNIQCTDDKENVIENADIIVLSMKPSDIKSAIEPIQAYITHNQVVISVAAGVSTEDIATSIEIDVPIIRVMPNTSASIGYSATAIAKGPNATDENVATCEALFQTIGTTIVIDEKDMHAVTGLSGSGPAYIYYLVEAMELAAIEVGLEEAVAKSLITQTIIGAGEMLKASGESPKTLRENVTSPGGTTEAGLKVLETFNFKEAMIECIKSARNRSIELGED